jgi:GMP synthase (glutamine-hydrolysing)
VQFHPEVTHTPEGGVMLKNFLDLCGCDFSWQMTDHIETLCARMREQCGDRKAFLLVSGGVDSTVAFALLNRALGADRVLGLHIDNGLMRQDESQAVMDYMKAHGFHNLVIRDATDDFLNALKGVVEPERKRKIIGDTFLTVKDAALAELNLNPEHWVLAQGTIYPDTIESGGTQHAAVIKTHHNRVDAIVELMKRGLVVEPLAECYKDEVRELGRLLEIPDRLIDRHPFPGPGLGVRLLCSSDATVPQTAAAKVTETLKSQGSPGLQGEILPVRSVGVQGDARTYAHPCVIRGIRDWEKADAFATALLNRVREVNRVVLEIGACKEQTNEALAFIPVDATCTRDRLDTLRRFDHTCTEALLRSGLYAKVWQMPVVLLPLTWAGKPVLVLRPVDSTEAMTASFARLPWPMLDNLWADLKAQGAGALLYDITHKPPGTIEWE